MIIMGNAPVFVETKKSRTEPNKHSYINLNSCPRITTYGKNMISVMSQKGDLMADLEMTQGTRKILKELDITA